MVRPTLRFALVMPNKRRQEKPARFVIGSSVPCFPSVSSRQATERVEANGLIAALGPGRSWVSLQRRRTYSEPPAGLTLPITHICVTRRIALH